MALQKIHTYSVIYHKFKLLFDFKKKNIKFLKFIMEENRNKLDQPIQEIYYCSRCKVKESDITCAMCEPYKYFCNNCNDYVHSLPSKKFHVRRKIQDKIIDTYNNTSNNESKLKASNSSNFKLSENFNKDKFSQVIKDKQYEIKKALENFEFNYTNNRFYNSSEEKENLNNRENEKKYNSNLYNTSKERGLNSKEFENYERGRLRENNSYTNYTNKNIENRNYSRHLNQERKEYSNNSLKGSYEEMENKIFKSKEKQRKFYNFRRNNTNQEGSMSRSPQKSFINTNNDINQNIGSNNYINEIKVSKFLLHKNLIFLY